jgi:ribonuclease M5
MKKISDVIIVEGKNDLAFLKSFIDADIVITGGTSMDANFWSLLAFYHANKRNFIVMSDPDSSGEKIRQAILKKYPNVKHIFIEVNLAKDKNKVGIEHASKETILELLDKTVSFIHKQKAITSGDLNELGLSGQKDSASKRNQLTSKLGIGYCNSKTLLNRLNGIGANREQIKRILEEIKQ